MRRLNLFNALGAAALGALSNPFGKNSRGQPTVSSFTQTPAERYRAQRAAHEKRMRRQERNLEVLHRNQEKG